MDIAYRNPATYPICVAILSKLLDFFADNERKCIIIKKIQKKFTLLPNTGHMEIWLQRISLALVPDMVFSEPLCRLVSDGGAEIWNCDWIESVALNKALDVKQIVNQQAVQQLDAIILTEEVALFLSKDWVS